MKAKITIQKVKASVLLLLFLISMAPKLYFHDALADHKDVTYCHHQHPTSFCLHQQGINCHFDTVVVTTPYLVVLQFTTPEPFFYYNDTSVDQQQSTIHRCHLSKVSRGPPVAS